MINELMKQIIFIQNCCYSQELDRYFVDEYNVMENELIIAISSS